MKNKLTFLLLLFYFLTARFVLAQTPIPADASTGVSINPTFSFTDYDHANAPYTFQLGIVGGNHNILTRSVSAAEAASGFTIAITLDNNTQYEWWVTSGVGPWYPNAGAVPGYTFTTTKYILPAQYAVGVSILPTFTWAGGNATITIATNTTFTSGVQTSGGVVASPYTWTLPLSNATVYYWSIDGGATYNEFTSVNAAKPTLNPIYPGVTSAYIGWYPVPYSSGLTYDLYITDDGGATWTPVAIGLTNTYYTVTGLVQGTTYNVQVRAKHGSVIVSYSLVSSDFTPAGPPMPIPSYPTNNTDDGDIYANPPTLFWYIEGNEPALTYEIEVVLNANPFLYNNATAVGVPTITSLKTFKKLASSLTAGSTYKWQVRSVAGSGITAVASAWSTATATFKMYTNVASSPIIPTPSWPVGNATVYMNPPTLYWYLGADATGLDYIVEVSTSSAIGGGDNHFTGTVVYTSAGWTADNLYEALPNSLPTGVPYFWHARSSLHTNHANASNWSSNGSFTIAATASGAATTPIPSWPVGGALIDGTMADITLSWTAYSTQPLSFKVRMATSPSVDGNGQLNHGSAVEGSYVATTTSANASSIFGTLTAGATYYWQVKSKLTVDPPLIESPWSMVASFSTAAGASSVVPLVVSPNYLQPLNNTVAVLTWNLPVQSESHLKYDVQYSKNADFSGAVSKTNLNDPSTLVTGLDQNSTYYWRVLSKTDNGSVSSYSTTGSFKTSGATAVENQEVIPTQFELSQNYPNPFNPTTRINFAIPQNSFVTIKVYDMLGREVKTLINQQMVSGNHSIDWNADNNLGNKVSTGMYIYRITAGNFVSTKKMVLIK